MMGLVSGFEGFESDAAHVAHGNHSECLSSTACMLSIDAGLSELNCFVHVLVEPDAEAASEGC